MTGSKIHDDATLIQQVAQGDENALCALVGRYGPRLWRVAFYLLGDKASADDVEQEVFIRVWQYAGRYNPSYTPAAWMYRIACNLCYSELRRRRRHLEFLRSSAFVGVAPSAADAMNAEELQQLLQSAIATLPSKQKAVFELREIEQFSNEEVAHILGLSADQAKSNYHHARKAVAKYLSRYGIQ